MSRACQVTSADRMAAALTRTLLRAGVTCGTIALLTVHGRKSGAGLFGNHNLPDTSVQQVVPVERSPPATRHLAGRAHRRGRDARAWPQAEKWLKPSS